MYQVNHVIKLDEKKFLEVSLWNMFCKKRILSVILIIIFAMGLITIASALPALKTGNTNAFIFNGGIGFVVIVMAWYLLYSNISRLKRSAKNEEFLAKTEKHIKMDEDKILNYRISAEEQISYEWKQLAGAYDTGDDIILCMKDEQILVFEKSKLQPEEIEFIKAKIDIQMAWKKFIDIKVWIAVAAVVIVLIAAYGLIRWMA